MQAFSKALAKAVGDQCGCNVDVSVATHTIASIIVKAHAEAFSNVCTSGCALPLLLAGLLRCVASNSGHAARQPHHFLRRNVMPCGLDVYW